LEWNDSAVEGSFKFIKRFSERSTNATATNTLPDIEHGTLPKESQLARKKVYEALKKSHEVFEGNFAFNTLVAACMEALNALGGQDNRDVWTEGYYILSNILEPIIPHICWELSEQLFGLQNLHPLEIKEEVFIENTLTLAVSINGKRRDEITINKDATKEEILAQAKAQCAKWIEGKEITKEIYVPNKLINIVVK
jgi:leucyl-tRNA synthetase